MSKHNRQRRAWKCAKCGAAMQRDREAPAQQVADLAAKKAGRSRAVLIHACGKCRAMYMAENGQLRPLTAAEIFNMNMECPQAVAMAEVMEPGSLILGTR